MLRRQHDADAAAGVITCCRLLYALSCRLSQILRCRISRRHGAIEAMMFLPYAKRIITDAIDISLFAGGRRFHAR